MSRSSRRQARASSRQSRPPRSSVSGSMLLKTPTSRSPPGTSGRPLNSTPVVCMGWPSTRPTAPPPAPAALGGGGGGALPLQRDELGVACRDRRGRRLKWLDRKGERGHELAMQDKALEFEKLRGALRMAEIGASADAAWNVGAIDALRDAVRTQGEKTGVRWADALSCSV